MLEPLRTVFDAIPNGVFALLAPPAIWANLAWASPFLKTNRHGLSGLVSLIAGLSMLTALEVDPAYFMAPFVFSCLAMLGMLTVMLWPPPVDQKKLGNKRRRRNLR